MARRNVERSCFLLLSALLLLAAALWPNRLRDSGEQSVKRYVCREMGWGLGEPVELLGGQTLEETRFVAFRRSAGTEEVFLLRFREDAPGELRGSAGHFPPARGRVEDLVEQPA